MIHHNKWPNDYRCSLSQKEHKEWNSKNYPGTRQLCDICKEPTERCEEDTLYDNDDNIVCNKCLKE